MRDIWIGDAGQREGRNLPHRYPVKACFFFFLPYSIFFFFFQGIKTAIHAHNFLRMTSHSLVKSDILYKNNLTHSLGSTPSSSAIIHPPNGFDEGVVFCCGSFVSLKSIAQSCHYNFPWVEEIQFDCLRATQPMQTFNSKGRRRPVQQRVP